MADESFFQRVTRLFRSGPAIRRKIKGHDPNNYYDQGVMRANHGYYTSGHTGYKRGGSPFSVMGEYGILDRLSKYSEFAEMEYTPEISTALDLYADETCSSDETGRRFHIYSENPKIQKALEELFYEVYNINFEARRDIRNLVKNGDFFRYVEVQPKIGVVLTEPVPVNEVSREEGFDPQDPTAVRFRLETYGGKYLENWQILHFRILSNDAYLPYGTSFLENVRRSWRQLCHASGTRVLTTAGYKNIENVSAGDVVYTHLPEKKQTIKTTVEAVVDMGVQPLVLVETSHRKIRVTPNHGLLICDKDGRFRYKKAEDLIASNGEGGNTSKNSDKLVLPAIVSGDSTKTISITELPKECYSVQLAEKLPREARVGIVKRLKSLDAGTGYKNLHAFLGGERKISLADYQLVEKEFGLENSLVRYYGKKSKKESTFFHNGAKHFTLDKDFFEFFGFMLGDGWLRKNGLGFALSLYEEQNQYYIQYATKLLGPNFHLTERVGTKSAQVNWNTTEAVEVFKHLGFKTGFANKQIPNWVFDLNLECRRAFLKGLFNADGCEKYKTICFANESLIRQTQELCWTVGVSVGKVITVRPARKGHKESYKLWIDLSAPSQEVVYENVLRITKQEVGQTWDLQVKHEEHNFIANGLVTHNTMIEDAMLVYRMVRSPERRVFYIDISGIKPEDVGNYMEAVKATIRSNTVTNRSQGLTDLRHNPMSVDDDYFMPTRPNSGTKIESLAGGQHVSATEDVEYIRGKVIAGLKVPKAYLGFDEALGSKATLAQEDIRFSKTIQALQEIYIAELNKLAILHLFAIGFQGEDLIDFELKLSNPSSVALQQKLAVISSRIDIAAKAWDLGKETGMVSIPWIQRNILELRGEELNQMFEEAIEDQKRLAFLKFTLESKPEESKDEQASVGEFEKGSVMPELLPPNELQAGSSMVKSVSIAPDSTGLKRAFTGMGLAPVKANQTPAQRNKNAKRNKQFSGQRALMNPGFAAMLDPNNKYTKDVYGQKGSVLLENIEGQIAESQKRGLDIVPNFLPASVRQTLKLFYESRMKEYEVDFESDDIATEMRTLVKG